MTKPLDVAHVEVAKAEFALLDAVRDAAKSRPALLATLRRPHPELADAVEAFLDAEKAAKRIKKAKT